MLNEVRVLALVVPVFILVLVIVPTRVTTGL